MSILLRNNWIDYEGSENLDLIYLIDMFGIAAAHATSIGTDC
jgi:hypothetical protein